MKARINALAARGMLRQREEIMGKMARLNQANPKGERRGDVLDQVVAISKGQTGSLVAPASDVVKRFCALIRGGSFRDGEVMEMYTALIEKMPHKSCAQCLRNVAIVEGKYYEMLNHFICFRCNPS